MTDPQQQRLQQQRLQQQLQPQQPNDPPAAAVATADDSRRPFVRVWGMLSAIVVLPAAIFAVSRSSQVSAFSGDAIMLSMGVTVNRKGHLTVT